MYSAAEYATPAWCRSAHASKVDVALNDTMRIITGCLRPTPADLPPVLSGIAPARLRRVNLTSRLVQKAELDVGLPLNQLVLESQRLGCQRLPSRHPFSRHAATFHSSNFNLLGAWNSNWEQPLSQSSSLCRRQRWAPAPEKGATLSLPLINAKWIDAPTRAPS